MLGVPITTLSVSERNTLSGTLRFAEDGISQVVVAGQVVVPNLVVQTALGNGTGQINTWYADDRTLTAGSVDYINLSNVHNPVAWTFGFTLISRVLVALYRPFAANTVLHIGPQGNAAAVPLWFGNTTSSTSYNAVYQKLDNNSPVEGWPVEAGVADILPIRNAGNATVRYGIWVLGQMDASNPTVRITTTGATRVTTTGTTRILS